MAELYELRIGEASKGLKEGEFSCEELARSCYKNIKAGNKELNAFVFQDDEDGFEERAYKRAGEIDGRFASGEKMSVLAGIPVGVKDIFNTKGEKTTCCSPILKDFVPPYDASVVSRLNDAGMVMLGKTNMDEFACGGSCEHSVFGPCRNPYNSEMVSGGSSGGSAAALAANMCTYSLGTDTGGSIRQPASFCGVYGMKVTYGRVSRSGVTSMASSWDTIGPFGRSTEDIAHILNVIAGKDVADLTTPDVEVPDYLTFLNRDVKGLRIGLPKEYFGEGVDKEVEAKVKEAVTKLERSGAEVIEVSLPMTKYAVAVYYVTMPAELSANLERFDGIRYGKKALKAEDLTDYYFEARGDGFGAEIKRRIMIGTYVLSAGYYDAYYKKAQKVRTLIIKDFADAFEKVDVLMAPVAPFTAFKVGELVDNPLSMYMADALTIPASAAGLPAMSVPVGLSSAGMPIGAQIIAPQFGEGTCLKVSSALEKL